MTRTLYLKSLSSAPTRKATPQELWSCIVGILVCTTVLVLGVVFMTVDVFWADTWFGTVFGVATWQIVNYVLNGVFTIVGILVGANALFLYRSLQRWLLVAEPGRPGGIPSVALSSPSYDTLFRLICQRPNIVLIISGIVTLFVPAFPTVSTFLLDFKQTSRSLSIRGVSSSIQSLLNSSSTDLPENIGLAPLSALVLPSTLAQVPSNRSSFTPAGSCLGAFTGCAGDSSLVNIIQFGGTSFAGASSYGLGAFPQQYWSTNATEFFLNSLAHPELVDRRLITATPLKVQRVAFAQSSNFTCQTIPANSSETPIGTPSSDDGVNDPLPVSQFVVQSKGPCFGGRNSTFIIGDADHDARFDIQACHSGAELQLQVVIFFPRIVQSTNSTINPSYVEAYACSSPVLDGLSRGVQLSPNLISASPPTNATPVSDATLSRFVDYLNWYFELPGWGNPQVPGNDGGPGANLVGTSRTQGDFTSVLRFNWVLGSSGNTRPYTWSGMQYLPAYGNALVSSLGTYLSSSFMLSYPDSRTYDTIEKQVIQLGSPAAIGGPLLSVVALLLCAQIALFWLCRQELLAMDTGDAVEMLRKVEVRESCRDTVIAELYEEGSDCIAGRSPPTGMSVSNSRSRQMFYLPHTARSHRDSSLENSKEEVEDLRSAELEGLLGFGRTSGTSTKSLTL